MRLQPLRQIPKQSRSKSKLNSLKRRSNKRSLPQVTRWNSDFMSNHQNVIGSWRWLNSPEWNVALFSFLLSFFWEVQQMPFYQVSNDFSCFDRTRNCTLATVGDVGISLTSFWVVAALSKSRQWVHRPNRRQKLRADQRVSFSWRHQTKFNKGKMDKAKFVSVYADT